MCGIVGYFSRRKDSWSKAQARLGLYAEQHRGQEACGIAWTSGGILLVKTEMGEVKEVFSEKEVEGYYRAAIGHVRYPTRGDNHIGCVQPFIVETLSGPIYSIASNGDVVNYDEVADELKELGIHFNSKNDGELLGRFIVYHYERQGLKITDAIKLVMRRIKGAYSAVFLTPDALYAFRDKAGFRPMLVGYVGEGCRDRLEQDVVIASETCATDLLRANNVREVQPGEILTFAKGEESSNRLDVNAFNLHPEERNYCIFELIYFARPDGFQFGELVYDVREKIGERLASYDDFKADTVVPVPDSANFIAQGYARAGGIPYDMALIRNHYVGRSFIRPDQHARDESVRQKFNPLRGFFEGKVVVLVDDSIVRGTTIKKLIRMIKGAGAREVHLRIGSPPVKHSCYYGIDTPNREKLIAVQETIAQIRKQIGADSLKFLKISDLRKCVSSPCSFCYACFNGKYPIL